MISGRQTLASIEQTIAEERSKTDAVGQRVEALSASLVELQQADARDYRELAKVRLDHLAGGQLLQHLNRTEQQVLALLERRETAAAELAERLATLVDSVAEPHVRALLGRALDGSREPGATFAVAPAAVRNHHAYRHGLLEHSVIVAEAAEGVAARFASVDRDLVVAGALLHDLGKTLAYTSDGISPQMTDVGRLHGEIVMGHDLVRDLIAEDQDFPPEVAVRLLHIIVAHHGMREKGSPVVPQTREAVIVHYCDDMTARIGAIDDAEAAAPLGERWTSRIFMIDAPAYLGPRDEPDEL